MLHETASSEARDSYVPTRTCQHIMLRRFAAHSTVYVRPAEATHIFFFPAVKVFFCWRHTVSRKGSPCHLRGAGCALFVLLSVSAVAFGPAIPACTRSRASAPCLRT